MHGHILFCCVSCILLSVKNPSWIVIDLWIETVLLLFHREFLFLFFLFLLFKMFHSLFEFILDSFKQSSLLSIWFLAILLIAFLRKSALRIQFTLEFIIIFFTKIVKQFFLFLCLILHSSLKWFRCLILAVLWWWPWCIIFASRVICLETIQCCRLCNRIKRLNNHSFLALFPHFPDIHQSILHPHILPIRLIPVCINLGDLPDLTHLLHKSIPLQLFDPLLLLLFLFHQPIFNPLAFFRIFLLTCYCCRLWPLH